MHRLYLYYCYQLGILPKKQQPRINRPELERIWKEKEKRLAEHAFVHDYKFPSLQAIVDYRKSLSQQMETLAAQRAEIVKQSRLAENHTTFDFILVDATEQQTYVITSFTFVQQFAEHFNTSYN